MKLTEHGNKLETNVKPESKTFGIGDASVIIEILRNRMYEHKVRTLVQEYMCNGRDAQRESNTDKKLIVTVPTAFSPTFKVRDFGIGINPDRMANVFIMYGSSTKRDTNTQTGGFGIGAKSAWSYTDMFTIVTFVDGVKRTYVAHTGVNNQGRLDLISTENTSEPNGTEIQIGVHPKDFNQFVNAALRASYFWNESEKPEFKGLTDMDKPNPHSALKLSDKFELLTKQLPQFMESDYNEAGILVVDGIPYTINRKIVPLIREKRISTYDHQDREYEESLADKLRNLAKSKLVIYVNNGVVDLAASRESISDSNRTREEMGKLFKEAIRLVRKHIAEAFDKVSSNDEWIATYTRMQKDFYVEGYAKYGPYEIRNGNIISADMTKVSIEEVELRTGRRGGESKLYRSSTNYIPMDALNRLFVVDLDETAVVHGRKLKQYLQDNQLREIYVLTSVEKTTKDAKTGVSQTTLTRKESEKALKVLVKDLGAKGTSSMPYTPPVRTPKAERIRTKEMFTLHLINNDTRKSPDTVSLEMVEARGNQYIYVHLDQWKDKAKELGDVAEYLYEHSRLETRICAVTDSTIELVKGHEKFTPYSEWKKNFAPSKKTLDLAKFNLAKNTKMMSLIRESDVKIKDAHVSKMLDEYKDVMSARAERKYDGNTLPKTILDWISKDALEQFSNDDKLLSELLKDKYPLLPFLAEEGMYSWFGRGQTAKSNELVLYINAKV